MYNKKESVIETVDELFFPSVLKNASSDKELVVLDDCSPLEKETKALVDKHLPELKNKFGNVVFEKNPENHGFAKSFNCGIKLASGDKLVIVNDDIYFPLDTVEALANTLTESKDYGMIGPISNYAWSYQHCGQAPKIDSYSQKELWNLEAFSSFVKDLLKGKRIATDNLVGFCFAMNSDLIKNLGGFDERYNYAFFEDTDLARRVSQDYELIINPEVFVYHKGSESLKQEPIKTGMRLLKNACKYSKKWNDYLGTIKMLVYDNYRVLTGRNTVSELIDKELSKREG
ncbi:glycosyltransferase [Candidatus Woesearchaeota archaeon]|nr:glycosyltransferase [Candidatus Woesearchaeota archaeon]